jgi:hypothetical protein
MIRKFKAVGLALVACFAMSALVASGAQAVEFHSNVEHVKLTGKQIGTKGHVFTVGGGFGNVTCEVAEFEGTGTLKTNTEQTMVPTYKNCTESAFGTGVTVTCETCGYIFTPNANTVHVEGEFILHTGTGCTIRIKRQTIEGGTSYDNISSSHDVVVTTDITNRVVSFTEGGFFACGVSNGEHKEGSYTGETTVTGTTTTGGAAEISVS